MLEVELFKCCRVSALVGYLCIVVSLCNCKYVPFYSICFWCFIIVTVYVPSVLVCVCNKFVLVKLFPLRFVSFLLLTLHPASRKRFVAGFQNPGN